MGDPYYKFWISKELAADTRQLIASAMFISMKFFSLRHHCFPETSHNEQ